MGRKIGILTFHWATNYGAVLQAYALQSFLKDKGFETEIINYVPWSIAISQKINWHKNHRTDMIMREEKLETFRRNFLVRTKRINFCFWLRRFSQSYFAVICGSDQIWNQSFALFGEYKPTLAYFASFARKKTRRIAYAASFGAVAVSERYEKYVKPELKKFSAISVREQTGKQIIEKLELKAEVVCDPTLLLIKEDYWQLMKDIKMSVPRVFCYVLHGHKETEKIAAYINVKLAENDFEYETSGLEQWLYAIQHSEIVVTNSFHGVMMSVILNKPFIAVLIKGSGMNDRITTILAAIGLENRAIDSYNEKMIDMIFYSPIEWDQVNQKIEKLRDYGKAFLEKVLI